MLRRAWSLTLRLTGREPICGGCGRPWPDADPLAACPRCHHSRHSRSFRRRRPEAHEFRLAA